MANIIAQIEYAGIKDSDLQGGIVGIGGGFRMKGLIDLLQSESNINVRRGTLPEYVRIEDSRANGVEIAEIASVLYAGATHSENENLYTPEKAPIPSNGVLPFANDEIEERKPKPEPAPKPKKTLLERMGRKMADLFGGGDEDDTDLLDD